MMPPDPHGYVTGGKVLFILGCVAVSIVLSSILTNLLISALS